MKEHQENDQKEKEPKQNINDPFQSKSPRDGYDNTGTQGGDSLKDDEYTGTDEKTMKEGGKNEIENSTKDETESTTKGFDKINSSKNIDESDEDRALIPAYNGAISYPTSSIDGGISGKFDSTKKTGLFTVSSCKT